jgi:hypothetical protein
MKPERWQQIKRLYFAALERGPEERAAFLEESCAGDEDLRREVESLIATQSGIDRFIESPAIEVASKALARDQAPPVDLIGRTIAHYRIVEKIGAGGMGVVYRARDEHLRRDVAVKILPEFFASDPERMARLDREAWLLASLNHPNIAAIHGLEAFDGKRFLVMELVEGETLAQKIAKGPLSVNEILDTCRQIAEGLEAAHEKGIIHRDLKPANVKITPEGKVKVLDFGLAKAFQGDMTAADPSKSPTLTDQMTRPGVILGTAAYMSPEQAKGKPVDKRTDIWAFGCVLYECLTGKRAFQGETITETLASILKDEPDLNPLPPDTPTNVRALIRRCLQKNARNRLHDIADARIEIDEAGASPAEKGAIIRRFPLGWILAVGALLFFAGILIRPLIWKSQESSFATGPVASVIKLAPGYSLDGIRSYIEFNWPSRTAMAISSDGRFIVYCAVNDAAPAGERPRLFLRRIDQLEASPIAGTDGGIAPFLSPDDRWVGFWADSKLKKVPIEGGMAQDICEATALFGASWGADDRIVFADPARHFGLSVVAASGGKAEILTEPDKAREERDHRLPSCLPNAQGVLFTIMRETGDLNPRVALFNNKAREWKVLLDDASDARYVPTGHLVFLRQAILMAAPFSLSNFKTTGQAVSIRPNIMQMLNSPGHNSGAGQFSLSKSGCLLYASGSIIPDWNNSLAWVDRKGSDEPASSKRAHNYVPRLSPDGKRIAYQRLGMKKEIWICDTGQDMSYPLISEGRSWSPLWTPDGRKVVFGWRGSGLSSGVFSIPSDGSAPKEQLFACPLSDHTYSLNSLSPDGNLLAFVDYGADQADIRLYNFTSQGITPFMVTEHNEYFPSFSPDGRWLAYSSDREGRLEVYVSLSSGVGGAVKVSREGGTEPGWARSGKQMFYRSLDGSQMWVVDVQTGTDFSAGKPSLLFESTRFGGATYQRCWDISLDDQRFLMVKREERPVKPVTEMILIQNWFEELKRLVPTGK